MIVLLAFVAAANCATLLLTEFNFVRNFLYVAGYSNNSLDNTFKLKMPNTYPCPPTFTSDPVQCTFSVNSVTGLTCNNLGGSFGSSEESRLVKLTKLSKLVLSGSATGTLRDTPYTSALTDLTIDAYFDGPIPDWVWSLTRFVATSKTTFDGFLPATTPSTLNTNIACTLPDDYFYCPIPQWAETNCKLNATLCKPSPPPTPMPTPLPTPMPTPQATKPFGVPEVELSPCPGRFAGNKFSQICNVTSVTCQGACRLFSCRDAYSTDDVSKYSPSEYYSCAQVLGEPACGVDNSDCRGAHAPDLYDGSTSTMDIGFGNMTTPTGLLVVENYEPGFMIGVDLWDNSTLRWVAVWRGAEANRTISSTDEPRYTYIAFNASTLATNRVQLLTSYLSYNEEIDAVFLVTMSATKSPTPAPPTPPTPSPAPTPQPTPAPVCEKASTLTFNSNLDTNLGDFFCVNTVCQWACVENDCSSMSSMTKQCSNVVGKPDDAGWAATTADKDVFVDVSFNSLANATGLVIIEPGPGTTVEAIDVWDEARKVFVKAWRGSYSNLDTGSPVEFYAFDNIASVGAVRRVNISFSEHRIHDVRGIRLVGPVAGITPPAGSGKRLPGIFVKSYMKLTSARYGMMWNGQQAAVINDTVYVPPGQLYNNGFGKDVPIFDKCNTTSGQCTTFTGVMTGLSKYYETSVGNIVDENRAVVTVMIGSNVETSFKFPDGVVYRTNTINNWAPLAFSKPRHLGCLVEIKAAGALYYGGGRVIIRNSGGAYQTYKDVDKITAMDGVPVIAPDATGLSASRCALGCAAVGERKDRAMWAGGWSYFNDSQHASDVVDIFDTTTSLWKATKMSHRTINPSIASIASLVMITGGTSFGYAPTYGDIDDAFLYTGYTNVGIDRYDLDGEIWMYVPMQLTKLLYDSDDYPPTRIAATFADRFIAVVSAETVFRHDGGVDASMINVTTHQRVIDLYDSVDNEWYRNQLDHHAGYGFVVAGVNNKLLVIGGRDPSMGLDSDVISMYEWRPFNYSLVECRENTNCNDCLNNLQRNKFTCRWCYNPMTNAGQCREAVQTCDVTSMYTNSILAGQKPCVTEPPTPMPTPAPGRYKRWWRIVISAVLSEWNWDQYGPVLAVYLGCDFSSLKQLAPAQAGSVIAFVSHEEPNDIPFAQANAFDMKWATITTGRLNITQIGPLPFDFVFPTAGPTAMPVDTTLSTTVTPKAPTVTTKSPTGADTTNTQKLPPAMPTGADAGMLTYILIAVGVVVVLCIIIAVIVAVVVSQRRKNQMSQRSLAMGGGMTSDVELDGKPRSNTGPLTPLDGPNDGSDRLVVSKRTMTSLSGSAAIDDKYLIRSRDIERGEKLGEGAFGIVYKARWRNIPVAVKEVKAEALGDKAQIESFEQEAVKMSQLRPHQNVVTLYGVCQSPLSIVTEFAALGSLDSWLHKNAATTSVSNLCHIALGAARGISHLHAEGIVHRDIAARNILLADGMVPKVADFGMSRVQAGEESGETRTRVGPLKWMAPEQLLKQQYSKMSDVFAFGVVLYEIMSGEEPWAGMTNVAACHRVLNGDRLPVPSRSPAQYGELMQLCFKTDISERPTMDDSAQRLERICNNLAASNANSSGSGSAPAMTQSFAQPSSRVVAASATSPAVNANTATNNNKPYDEPSLAGSGTQPLSVSAAYSLAPQQAALSEADGSYGEAPPPIAKPQVEDGAYSEPNVGGATNSTAPNAAIARSAKEEAKLWRLSKKYEPKSDAPPAAVAASQIAASSSGAAAADAPDDAPLPDGWKSAVSPKSGRVYYYHKSSKKTQWVRPTGPDG